MDPKLVTPVLLAAFVAFVLYRRVRRNIGRQAVSPARLQWRVGIFGVVGALFLFMSLRDISLLGAMIGGLAAGVALGWLGLRHTKFENTPQGKFYTPHTYIGMFVSALLLARIAYRFISVYPAMQAAQQAAQQADPNPFAAYQNSPLTVAIFGVLVGYYVFYYVGVLNKSRSTAMEPAPKIE
jgi:hypothetical protein